MMLPRAVLCVVKGWAQMINSPYSSHYFQSRFDFVRERSKCCVTMDYSNGPANGNGVQVFYFLSTQYVINAYVENYVCNVKFSAYS